MKKGNKFKYISLMIIVAIIFGAGLFLHFVDNKKNAVDFNNEIVDIQNSFRNEFLMFVQRITFTNISKEQADLEYEALKASANKSLEDIKSIKAPKDGKNLKTAAEELFANYKSLLDIEYKEIIDIMYKTDVNDEDKTRLGQLLEQTVIKEKTFADKFLNAQSKFAKENDLEVKE